MQKKIAYCLTVQWTVSSLWNVFFAGIPFEQIPSHLTWGKEEKSYTPGCKSQTNYFIKKKKILLVCFHEPSDSIKFKEKIMHRSFSLMNYFLFLVTQNLLSRPQEPVTEYSLYTSSKSVPSPSPLLCKGDRHQSPALESSGPDSISDLSWPFKRIIGFFFLLKYWKCKNSGKYLKPPIVILKQILLLSLFEHKT